MSTSIEEQRQFWTKVVEAEVDRRRKRRQEGNLKTIPLSECPLSSCQTSIPPLAVPHLRYFCKGDRVAVLSSGQRVQLGEIAQVKEDATCDVELDDGDVLTRVSLSNVRLPMIDDLPRVLTVTMSGAAPNTVSERRIRVRFRGCEMLQGISEKEKICVELGMDHAWRCCREKGDLSLCAEVVTREGVSEGWEVMWQAEFTDEEMRNVLGAAGGCQERRRGMRRMRRAGETNGDEEDAEGRRDDIFRAFELDFAD
eukprot:765614-Hanusia_phi.AAC.2